MNHRKARKHTCCGYQSDDESEVDNEKVAVKEPTNAADSHHHRKTTFNIPKNTKNSNIPIKSQLGNSKKILILDIDETLLHTIDFHLSHVIERILNSSNGTSPDVNSPTVTIDIHSPSSQKSPKKYSIPKFSTDYFHPMCNYFRFVFQNNVYYACERPRVREFLNAVFNLFDVYIYTAGLPSYARQMINHLCPQIAEDHCRYRNSCVYKRNRLYKNIASFSKTMNDVLIVDDNPEMFHFWPNNCILCKPFWGEYDEKQLESNEFVNNLYMELNKCQQNNHTGNAQKTNGSFKDQKMIAKMIDDDYLMEILLPVLVEYAKADDVQKFVKSKAVKKLEMYSAAQ